MDAQFNNVFGTAVKNNTIGNAQKIKEGSFAEGCYDQNSISELRSALGEQPDKGDMKEWGLTESEWRKQIQIALEAKLEDAK